MILKRICIALFAITVWTESSLAQKKITLDDIWASRKLNSNLVYGLSSMKDGVHYTSMERKNDLFEIVKYEYKTGKKVATIVSAEDLMFGGTSLNIDDYFFNQDETKLLVSTETEPIYRRSSLAFYYIIDLKTKKITPLAPLTMGKQRLAEFSPNGKMVAFVRNNNVYIYDITSGREFQITSDGKENTVIYGATDWVYEEELSFAKAFEWSPNNKFLAFYRFNETRVMEFEMEIYGELYPFQYRFKYPKAGEENSIVSIHVYDIEKALLKEFDLGLVTDQYIARIKWTAKPNELCMLRLNRLQNKCDFLVGDASKEITPKIPTSVLFTEASETFIEETYDNLTFLENGKHFIWNSERDGFNHLYLVNSDGTITNQITKGNFDIIDFLGVNEKTETIYYTSSEVSPMEKHLYSIKLNGTNKKKLTTRSGYNEIEFSRNFNYFITINSTANTPEYITLNDSKGALVKILENNENLLKSMAQYPLSKKEFFTVKNRENIELNGWMIKPQNFDPNKKYPVFMFVYGGPGHNTVLDHWDGKNYFYHQYLAQEGYIVVSVDNRGTMYRGRDFKNSTYMNLGKLESEDQIDVAKHLQTLSFVDAKRIGIMGWSFGGYMSSLCLLKANDLFKMGIAVAPVTNWRFYDTIYTERFMRTPQENPEGYDHNSPIHFADLLKGKYLLIHGMADDNVHFQNAVEMTDALIKANKQFDSFAYPNKNHGIYGGTTRLHLYTLMSNYIKNNL